jgi:phage terminase large subunit
MGAVPIYQEEPNAALKVAFKRTTAVNKVLKLKKRIKILPGSTSAGKTIAILARLIDKAIKTPGLEISVVAQDVPHLKKGALKDFLKIMKMTGRYNDKQYHKTDRIYTYSNGSYIEFFGVADDPDKLRGPRRDILYMNEANNLPWEAYKQASIRTNKEIWLDFNPTNEFWAHDELTDDPDAEWLTLTYNDNEALEPAIVRELEKDRDKAFFDPFAEDLFAESNIKSKYWANYWKVYGLGELGVLEGVVFNNWDVIEVLPAEARYLGTGIDFGYTNDPTTITDYYKYNGQIIWDERTYLTGLKNSDIAHLLKSQGRTAYDRIVADSAEPKSIDEINDYGFNIEGAEKGADSINFGIDIIQQEDFLITARSKNLKNELRRYEWDEDKTGKRLNRPIDAFNHCIDPARYFYTKYISRKNLYDPKPANEAYKKALKLLG